MEKKYPTDADLVSFLRARGPGVRIAVVGDVMLDRFADGEVHRSEADSAAPVLLNPTTRDAAGGAANVALNVAALGADVSLVGLVGADEAMACLRTLLCVQGVNAMGLVIEPGRPTTLKKRFRDREKTLLRLDCETRVLPGSEVATRLEQAAQEALEASDLLILSDYVKGALGPDLAARLVRAARQRRVPVLVDSKSEALEAFAGATCLTPNERELQRVASCGVSDDAMAAGARTLRERLRLEAVIVTLAERGASLFAGDLERRIGADAQVHPVDASGAGDSFIAALGVALGSGLTLADAARVAHLAGSRAAGRSGTSIIGIDDLLSPAASEGQTVNAATPDDETLHRVEGWRRAGLKIGFTNGCFDLLHAGHIQLLDQARAACDRLVVGINADGSVRQLKGVGRPVHTLSHRMAVLSALRAVDHVVAFSEPTPLRLIESIRPDVLIKGSDYRIDQVVGAPEVVALGGRVMLVDILEGLSTTSSLSRRNSGAA